MESPERLSHTPGSRQARHHRSPQLRIAGNRHALSFFFVHSVNRSYLRNRWESRINKATIMFLSSRRGRRHRPRNNRSSDKAVRASIRFATHRHQESSPLPSPPSSATYRCQTAATYRCRTASSPPSDRRLAATGLLWLAGDSVSQLVDQFKSI